MREFRFWIFKDEIVTASEYSWEKDKELLKEIPQRIYDYVRSIIKVYTPDICFTIDIDVIGSVDVPEMLPNTTYVDCFKVIEVNSYSSSGFYGADINKIIQSIIIGYPKVAKL